MRTPISLTVCVAVLAVALPASAQTPPTEAGGERADFVAIEEVRTSSLSTRRTLLTSVLVEGVVSAVGGGLLMITDADDQAWRYAGFNSAAFGVANVIIGAVALLGISSEEAFVLTPRASESDEQRTARLLRHALADERRESVGHAINLGLGMGYAAIGGTAILASQLGADNPDRWLASGVAIALQAVFLIAIDLWGAEASGTAHRRLLDLIATAS